MSPPAKLVKKRKTAAKCQKTRPRRNICSKTPKRQKKMIPKGMHKKTDPSSSKTDPSSSKTDPSSLKTDPSSSKTLDSDIRVAEKLNDSLETAVDDALNKEIIFKVNKLFTADLKSPKLTPFSPLKFCCNSYTSCKELNHKTPVAQIHCGDEQVLMILVSDKCWSLLLVQLSCNITQTCYISPLIFRSVLFGIVDDPDEKNSLALVDVLKKHLLLHPPCRNDLKLLYHNILLGKITTQENFNSDIVKYDFLGLLSKIEDTCKNVSKITLEENPPEFDKQEVDFPVPSSTKDLFSFITKKYIKNDNILALPEFNFKKPLSKDNTGKVDVDKLLGRLFLVFSIMLDILEENFRGWWMKSRYKLNDKLNLMASCPLIAHVGWKKSETKGSVNEHCIRIFMLFNSCPLKYKHHISRYIAILFEIARANENNEGKQFPFFGSLCRSFSNELSCHIKGADESKVSLVQLIYPNWLRFKVSGCLLRSDITSGSTDDLQSVYRILLRNLCMMDNEYISTGKSLQNKLKLSIIKDINIKNSEGETSIHKFCRTNNVKALKEYLQYPETNVNIADNIGWTALHNAAKYNSINCLKMLIKYRLPPIKGAEKLNLVSVNSENESPLMCAVREGNIGIVDILLKNGVGPTVLNINTKGESSIDMATNEATKEMLLNSWRSSISSFHYLKMDEEELELWTMMFSSYCDVYHIKEYCDSSGQHFNKPDSVYKYPYGQYIKDEITFDRLRVIVDTLEKIPSNPKHLKEVNLFLKSYSL